MTATRDRLTPGRQELVIDHVDWARRQAALFARRRPSFRDDIESAALVGLVEAALGFDPAVGVLFTTYAERRVWGAMADCLRRWGPRGFRRTDWRANPGEAPTTGSLEWIYIGSDDEGPVRLRDLIADGSEPVGWEAEYQDEVAGLARRVGGRDGEVFRRLYARADCLYLEQAGRSVGVCQSRAQQIRESAVATLRVQLGIAPSPERSVRP